MQIPVGFPSLLHCLMPKSENLAFVRELPFPVSAIAILCAALRIVAYFPRANRPDQVQSLPYLFQHFDIKV
jgi:hypothetical protein